MTEPRISSEQAAREREYWIERARQPRTEAGRRRLARAQAQWARAEAASERERTRKYRVAAEREIAEIGYERTPHARRRWPPGSEVYELLQETATARRMRDALQERLTRGWSAELADQYEEWEMRAKIVHERALLAMDRDRFRRNPRPSPRRVGVLHPDLLRGGSSADRYYRDGDR